jgi:hypothetical protein
MKTYYILKNKFGIETKTSKYKVAMELQQKHGWKMVGQYTLDSSTDS